MPFQKYVPWNNAQGTLQAGISAGAGTMILQTGQGGRFPSTFPFLCEIKNVDIVAPFAVLKREIVKVTGRTGDTCTITRSAGTCLPNDASNTPGTTAFSFSTGDTVTLTVTAETIKDIQDEVALKLPTIGGLRTDFGVDKTVNIDPATGDERLVDTSLVTTLPDTYELSVIDPATGEEQRATMANVKNLLATAGKYIRTVTLGENIAAASTQNYTAQAFTTIQPAGLTYGGNMSTPEGAFDTNVGTTASAGNPAGVPRTCIVSNIIFPVKITNFSFTGTTQYGIAANTVKVFGTRIDGTIDQIYNHVPAVSAGTYNINATITSTEYYVSFTVQQLDLGNGSTSINTVVTTGTYDIPALNVMAIVDRILYRNVLASAAGANQTRAGIRVNVPYPCKIRNVKTWQTTSSSSASILILDASGNTLQTKALTTGQQVADINYTFAANTEYRVVLNDTANWTSWSTYNYATLATFQGTFPYLIGSVYGAGAGTLDNANGYIFTELELDYQGRAFKARANRVIESEFAMVSGFAIGPQTAGASMTLDNNNGTLIAGAGFAKRGVFFVSNLAGYVHFLKGTVESVAGYATSLTNLIISWSRPKRVQLISDSFAGAGFSIPKMFTGGEFDYTLTNSSTAITYLQWSFDKTDWTDVDSWSAASSTSWKGNFPRGYFRVYNPASTTWSYTIT